VAPKTWLVQSEQTIEVTHGDSSKSAIATGVTVAVAVCVGVIVAIGSVGDFLAHESIITKMKGNNKSTIKADFFPIFPTSYHFFNN